MLYSCVELQYDMGIVQLYTVLGVSVKYLRSLTKLDVSGNTLSGIVNEVKMPQLLLFVFYL